MMNEESFSFGIGWLKVSCAIKTDYFSCILLRWYTVQVLVEWVDLGVGIDFLANKVND